MSCDTSAGWALMRPPRLCLLTYRIRVDHHHRVNTHGDVCTFVLVAREFTVGDTVRSRSVSTQSFHFVLLV